MLKVSQSEAWSWPVLTAEEKGRLMVRELVEVEMLKMVPEVPVETVVMTLEDKLMVVLVPINTCCPPEIDNPDPTVKLPRVVVPIPPLETPNTPETSEEPRAMAPLKRFPDAMLLTGRAEEREEMVVEPVTVRVPVKLVVAR